MNCCKICNECFEAESSFHRHFFRAHKITVKEYYQEYYPRRDKYDGKLLPFRNKQHYFETEFATKGNFVKWLTKKASRDEAQEYVLRLLNERREAKDLTHAPCQVTARSTSLPSIIYFDKIFDSYEEAAERAGLQVQYKEDVLILRKKCDNFTIGIDTREQKPLKFNCRTVSFKCDVGDYTALSDYHSNVFIDRKSPPDFIQSFTKGLERFENEILRAKDLDSYLIVLIEYPLSSMLVFDRTYLKRFTKVSPSYLFRNVRYILEKYNNIQFLFVKDRREASEYVEKLLLAGESVKNVDLQLAYDTKKI